MQGNRAAGLPEKPLFTPFSKIPSHLVPGLIHLKLSINGYRDSWVLSLEMTHGRDVGGSKENTKVTCGVSDE